MLINGGRRPQDNYQSHLLHVRQALRVLHDAGVPAERTVAFISDGADPSPDLATREQADPTPESWRLAGTRAEAALRPPLALVNSELDGFAARPATLAALQAWFEDSPIAPGDTVLLYVTDHGERNASDSSNNSISLWGEKEDLSVAGLRDLLRRVPKGARVVSVMSQCFSGSFAELDLDAKLDTKTCGFFSSTAERPAYGCYAENRGRDNVGHSFHFLDALGQSGSLVGAHQQTLVADDTPDVPLRTSDVFLQRLLAQNAAASGRDPEAILDELLNEAWHDAASWEQDIRLLDRVAQRFGYSGPRSFADLKTQTQELPQIAAQLIRVAQAWKAALADANRAVYARFLARAPEWQTRLPDAQSKSDLATLSRLRRELAAELSRFAQSALPEEADRLQTTHTRGTAAAAARYRMEVRLAALLRLETLLTSVAGRQYLRTRGTDGDRRRFDDLQACEDLHLPVAGVPSTVETTADFPAFAADTKQAQAALPSFLGIQFRDLDQARRQSLGASEGAASVLAVFPDTPAARAGLQVGDILLGANDRPFWRSNEVRLWSMLAPAGETAILKVSREGREQSVGLFPAPYPMQWPELPGPPKLGATAPPLHSVAYRGTLPGAQTVGQPRILFFWATWCAICKTALPELLAYSQQHDTPIIAISDEPREILDKYFNSTNDPFPPVVAIDWERRDFASYGISGSPTFVLIDGEGNIQSIATGYSRERGIPFPGWKWNGR